jgi:hypothetical protein
MDLNVSLPVIGIVHTSHAELEATPIQAGLPIPAAAYIYRGEVRLYTGGEHQSYLLLPVIPA